MKHRVRINRRDGIRQRYWVGKSMKKNYGGGPLFGKRLEEKGIRIRGTPKEKRIMMRLFERNPELIEPNLDMSFSDKIPNDYIGEYNSGKRRILIQNPIKDKRFVPKDILKQATSSEEILKHEIAHSRQSPSEQYIDTSHPSGYSSNISDKEKEAYIAEKVLPQRKRKISQEQISKSFREVFKDGA